MSFSRIMCSLTRCKFPLASTSKLSSSNQFLLETFRIATCLFLNWQLQSTPKTMCLLSSLASQTGDIWKCDTCHSALLLCLPVLTHPVSTSYNIWIWKASSNRDANYFPAVIKQMVIKTGDCRHMPLKTKQGKIIKKRKRMKGMNIWNRNHTSQDSKVENV